MEKHTVMQETRKQKKDRILAELKSGKIKIDFDGLVDGKGDVWSAEVQKRIELLQLGKNFTEIAKEVGRSVSVVNQNIKRVISTALEQGKIIEVIST